ncbi:MAG: LOG family protein, partial [Thermomicrobiales bacterium]
FEALTLIQTGKLQSFPVILFGIEFWSGLLDWIDRQLVVSGKLTAAERALLHVTDDLDDAVRLITQSYRASGGQNVAVDPAGGSHT